jgi:hypothetical protein
MWVLKNHLRHYGQTEGIYLVKSGMWKMKATQGNIGKYLITGRSSATHNVTFEAFALESKKGRELH